MSGLENLTAKILEDANARAAQIVKEAEEQAAGIVGEATAQARREGERILQDAQAQAAHSAEQIVLGKQLEIRDQNLQAKQQVLDRVFRAAAEKLNDMPKEQYWKFLCDYLLSLDTDGEELLLPARYGVTSLDELNGFLKDNGKKGNLALSTSPRQIRGGFVLSKDGIEQNNTFEALIDYYRYELEGEVLAILYQQ